MKNLFETQAPLASGQTAINESTANGGKFREPEESMMTWTRPLYSRNQYNAAASAFVADDEITGLEDEWLEIMSNWRAAHSYPLHAFQTLLRRRVQSVEKKAVVSQRLKRIESIINKLKRFDTLKLTQMQDIAGCRAILKKLRSVHAVADSLQSNPGSHSLIGQKDYISHPKRDGYRGIHLVFQFNASGAASVYRGQRVEVQLRTEMQHVWATTVEAVDAFTNQAIKSNHGSADWMRFFALVSSVIALDEGCPTIPETYNSVDELAPELSDLVRKLNVVETIRACRATVDYSGNANGHYFLLRLDPATQQLAVRKFRESESEVANTAYLLTEVDAASTRELTVLVSAKSIRDIKKAYPNYFLDMGRFLKLIERF